MAGYAQLFNTPRSCSFWPPEVSGNTLLRFYVLHIMVFPLVGRSFMRSTSGESQRRRDFGAAMTAICFVVAALLAHAREVRSLRCSAPPMHLTALRPDVR